ncbi:MAG: hypothetical protein ACYC26_14695 [Phycisphaerales bacterium]
MYVERHVRIKYRRINHENLDGTQPEVVIAPPPQEGLPKCLAAPSLLAQIAVSNWTFAKPDFTTEYTENTE